LLLNGKRCESEIIYDIIKFSKSGIKKTSLMYSANLSFYQLNRYLDRLIEEEIISEKKNNGSRLFFMTEKGEELLTSLEKIVHFFND